MTPASDPVIWCGLRRSEIDAMADADRARAANHIRREAAGVVPAAGASLGASRPGQQPPAVDPTWSEAELREAWGR